MKMRDQVLRDLTTPILFIQGTWDKLCPLNVLQTVRAEIKAPNELHVVEERDHSLLVTKRWLKAHEQTQEDVDQAISKTIGSFLDSHAKENTLFGSKER